MPTFINSCHYYRLWKNKNNWKLTYIRIYFIFINKCSTQIVTYTQDFTLDGIGNVVPDQMYACIVL